MFSRAEKVESEATWKGGAMQPMRCLKLWPLAIALVSILAGCTSSNSRSNEVAVRLVDAEASQEFQGFMAARGVPVLPGQGNSISWKDTPTARTSVQAYLGILKKRKALIAENLAKEETTAPVDEEHYHRRELVVNGDGNTVEVVDRTELKRKYDPTHPYAGADGYVAYTNVDRSRELLDDIAVTRTYNVLLQAMGGCDPGGEMQPMEMAGSVGP